MAKGKAGTTNRLRNGLLAFSCVFFAMNFLFYWVFVVAEQRPLMELLYTNLIAWPIIAAVMLGAYILAYKMD